eukprot:COSAG01_NODE_6726_length_3526_cov_68.199883_4_plen_114_part_00
MFPVPFSPPAPVRTNPGALWLSGAAAPRRLRLSGRPSQVRQRAAGGGRDAGVGRRRCVTPSLSCPVPPWSMARADLLGLGRLGAKIGAKFGRRDAGLYHPCDDRVTIALRPLE